MWYYLTNKKLNRELRTSKKCICVKNIVCAWLQSCCSNASCKCWYLSSAEFLTLTGCCLDMITTWGIAVNKSDCLMSPYKIWSIGAFKLNLNKSTHSKNSHHPQLTSFTEKLLSVHVPRNGHTTLQAYLHCFGDRTWSLWWPERRVFWRPPPPGRWGFPPAPPGWCGPHTRIPGTVYVCVEKPEYFYEHQIDFLNHFSVIWPQ